MRAMWNDTTNDYQENCIINKIRKTVIDAPSVATSSKTNRHPGGTAAQQPGQTPIEMSSVDLCIM